jgi:hypothetical protein
MRLALVLALEVGPALAGAPASEELAAGQVLAERLRSARPEENSEVHGRLILRAGKQTQRIPMVCRVVLKEGDWETSYETAATTNANAGAERLVIRHGPDRPNEYLYARAAAPEMALPPLAPVAAGEAGGISLARSDFSLGDLGLEFLHWPEQRRLQDERHLDRSCYVLESCNPRGGGITRVKSYFDKESGGLLIADAYDADGRAAKEFSLHGSSFKKVNGHWRLERMGIRNLKTRSQTEIKFDIEP